MILICAGIFGSLGISAPNVSIIMMSKFEEVKSILCPYDTIIKFINSAKLVASFLKRYKYFEIPGKIVR
jgi:hypothetical protein